jgi:hypothetical protein
MFFLSAKPVDGQTSPGFESATAMSSLLDATAAPVVFQWTHVEELGYPQADVSRNGVACFHCGKKSSCERRRGGGYISAQQGSVEETESDSRLSIQNPLFKCAQCTVASYCQKNCQVADWKNGHKKACASYHRLGPHQQFSNPVLQGIAREEILRRSSYYSCPYAVHKAAQLGRGFLFFQASHSLAEMSLLYPVDCFGRALERRSVLLHYLTVGEYDSELCRDDFEMTSARTALHEAVEAYDERKSVVLLVRFRCGHFCAGIAPLIPDYDTCCKLGADYYQNVTVGALELQLDDL